uniref:pertactin-like passenger domain-containing protein n=1 Tax=Bordetella sputigena TaxID=1416810 RepID=UPI0039EE94DA
MSYPQHPASPPSSYPHSMFQRFRLSGGIPVSSLGQLPWIRRALYGATSFGLLAYPPDPVYAGGGIRHYGPSGTTIEATRGDAGGMARVQGPVVTRGAGEHAVQALHPGSAVLSGLLSTSGDDAYAVYYGAGTRLVIADADLATGGARAHAVQGMNGMAGMTGMNGAAAGAAPSLLGELALQRGTITLHGPDSTGVHAAVPVVRLGRPLQPTGNATLWSMGYTSQASAHNPDVRILGQAPRNTGVSIHGRRRLELNGVGISLRETGAVAMSVGATARVDGRNVGIAATGPDSFGLRVRGDAARRDDAARCPVPTKVHLADGFIAMAGRNSPAVEVVRAQVSLKDVAVTTSQDARFAVGNEAGVFRMQATQGRGTLRSAGSALAAWTGNDRETARFDFRNVSIHSGSASLLEVGRDRGDSGPALPAHVELALDDSDARGRIWSGDPDAPRVDVKLTRGASWQGHTDIGRTVTVASRGEWKLDGDSTVQRVVLDQGTVAFREPDPAADERAGPAHAKRGSTHTLEEPYSRLPGASTQPTFHRLHVLQDIEGKGTVHMRSDTALGTGDKIVVDGAIRGNVTVAVRDTRAISEVVTSVALIHAANDGGATYTLANNAPRVMLAGHAFQLQKQRAADSAAVTVWAVPEGAPFIRGHDTLDLPPPGSGQVVVAEAAPVSHGGVDYMHLPPPGDTGDVMVAEMPAGFQGTFDAYDPPPPREPAPPVIGPAPAFGEIERKQEREITVARPPAGDTPPGHGDNPVRITLEQDIPDRTRAGPPEILGAPPPGTGPTPPRRQGPEADRDPDRVPA